MQQRAFSQAGSGCRITSYSRCRHPCTGGTTRSRRDISVASVSYEQSVPPPPSPPPPPPPPMQQDFSRRGALAYAGAALGFMMTGASAGWVLANNRAGENGNFSGAAQSEIVSMRMEAGFRRDFDGSLWLQEPSGTWHETKLDAKLPGTVLLRNDEDSTVSFITYSIQQGFDGLTHVAHCLPLSPQHPVKCLLDSSVLVVQIDLTDDNVVASIFGDRNWPALIQAVQVRNDLDELMVLALERDDFQSLVSMME